LRVYGEAVAAEFAMKHPLSRRPIRRFLEIARESEWPHFPSVKKSFAAVDYAPSTGTLIFDVGGNTYRLIARVDFEEQMLLIQDVLTHGQYVKEDF
jgi:mRNA interferase HigB